MKNKRVRGAAPLLRVFLFAAVFVQAQVLQLDLRRTEEGRPLELLRPVR